MMDLATMMSLIGLGLDFEPSLLAFPLPPYVELSYPGGYVVKQFTS